MHTFIKSTTLLTFATPTYFTLTLPSPTCFSPQRAVFTEHDRYLSTTRSTKWVTGCKIHCSDQIGRHTPWRWPL